MNFRNKTRTYSWPSININSHFAFQILAFNLIKKELVTEVFFIIRRKTCAVSLFSNS